VLKHLGIRHCTEPGSKSSERIAKLLEKLLSSVSTALKAPVCKTDVEIDCRSSVVRIGEVSDTPDMLLFRILAVNVVCIRKLVC
jgi:hypothetical protein